MKSKNLTAKAKEGRTGNQFVYVLECIENCSRATDEGKEFATDYDKISFFFGCFVPEYNYIQNRKRYPNLQDRIAEYLKGLPSCFAIDYWNDDIINIGKSWGYCQTAKKSEEFIENWFKVIALRIIQIANKVGFDLSGIA